MIKALILNVGLWIAIFVVVHGVAHGADLKIPKPIVIGKSALPAEPDACTKALEKSHMCIRRKP